MTQLLDTDPAKEVAIFGAISVKAPIAQYLDAVRHIEEFEKGDNFLVTKRISSLRASKTSTRSHFRPMTSPT